MPLEPSRIRIERDDRIGVEIVAGPLIRVPVGTGVADSPIRQVELRIERSRDPDRAAPVFPRLGIAVRFGNGGTRRPCFETGFTGARNGMEAPDLLAASSIVR